MDLGSSGGRTAAWRGFGILAAIILYAISLSGSAYDLTSPVTLQHHELLRKTYAVLAFALLGFAFERSKLRRTHGVLAAGIVIAVYSYAIEIGQILVDHTVETFAEHAFDVASGLAGGALGAFAVLLIAARSAPARRIEAVALVIAFGLLAWAFSVTYGRIG